MRNERERGEGGEREKERRCFRSGAPQIDSNLYIEIL
jgi:hypothetical protein